MNYSTSQPLFISADWLLDGLGNAVKDGAVLIDQGKIVKITQWQANSNPAQALPDGLSSASHKHFAGGIITPGLFNLHTHIDYTLAAPIYLNEQEPHMFDWLRSLVTMARTWDSAKFVASAASGAQELALSGVSYAVDSSFSGQAAHALVRAGLKGTVGLELFGVDKDRAQLAFDHWQKRYQELVESPDIKAAIQADQLRVTVAPHAPYTVSPALWQKARQWARQRQLMVLAHLAESPQESNWLAQNEEVIDQYLEFVLPPNQAKSTAALLNDIDWKGHGNSPVAHLKQHDLLDGNLLAAHCLHLQQQDYKTLAQVGTKAALCPRSNKRLGNGIPQIKAFIQHQIPFGLGTDSRGSSPDLSIREEAAQICRDSHQDCQSTTYYGELAQDPCELLKVLTSKAAQIMAVADKTGSLTSGLAADICVFIGHRSDTSLAAYKTLFEPQTTLDTLLVNGKPVVSSGHYQAIEAK